MKKSEIISEYNSLTATLTSVLKDYKKLTGKDWEEFVMTGTMNPARMNCYKETLETDLDRRMSAIRSITLAMEIWEKTEFLKSTEEGRNFIKSYEDEKKSLEKKIDEIGDLMVISFEGCLMKSGMGDWKVVGNKELIPERSYVSFDIEKTGMEYVRLSVCVDLLNNKGMEVSSSLHCGGRQSINDFDKNYWQFKGYTLMHENHEIFNHWMDKVFRTANIEVRNFRDRIKEIERILADPMSEYKKIKK